MDAKKGTLRICENGHKYYKSSDCPVCPICEDSRKPEDGFLSLLAAPARRALEQKNITTLEALTNFQEKDLLQLHGFGKSSIPKLKDALAKRNLNFRKGD